MANEWHNDFQDILSEKESLDNAQLVADRLFDNGWDKKSISALIGNMRAESFVNPNMYELACSTYAEDCGYGLVQWTPRSKYVNWAQNNGYSQEEIEGDAQLDRIDYEAENEIQYVPNSLSLTYGQPSQYDLSFKDFRKNSENLSIDELTEAFMWNYERPDYQAGLNSLDDRKDFAKKAYDKIEESSSGGSSDGGSSGFVGTIKDAINTALDKIEEMTQWDMYSIGSDRQFSNKYFYIMKTYNNTYKLKLNTSFIDEIQDIINNSSDASSGGSSGSGSDNEGKGKNGINTCSLKLDRNVMQWFHGTAEDAAQNGYPYPTAHHGIDLRFNYEPVYAVMEGTVEDLIPGENPATNGGIGYDGDGFGWGNRVSVKNEDGRGVMYAHLSEINVEPGDKVKVGDKIGVSGNTGEQTNTPHLHFELYDPKNSPYPDGRIDPLKFIKDHCSDYKNLDVKKDDTPID